MQSKAPAYGAMCAACLGWSLSPIFIRYLSGAYDPFTQTLVRYFSATLVLFMVCLWSYPEEIRKAATKWRPILGLACINVAQQSAWTVACYHTTATTAQLITKLQVPSVILLSFLLFREERAIIKHPLFLIGSFFGLIGVAGVLVKEPSVSLLPTFDFAALLLFAVAIGWAFYAVWGKHTVADIHPIPMFAFLALFTTLGFGILSCTFGDPQSIVAAGPRITLIALFSGTLPIAVAHASFHYAQKYLGAAFCGAMLLLNPLLTHLFALFLWRDEMLSWLQWSGALILIAGSALVITAERRAAGRS